MISHTLPYKIDDFTYNYSEGDAFTYNYFTEEDFTYNSLKGEHSMGIQFFKGEDFTYIHFKEEDYTYNFLKVEYFTYNSFLRINIPNVYEDLTYNSFKGIHFTSTLRERISHLFTCICTKTPTLICTAILLQSASLVRSSFCRWPRVVSMELCSLVKARFSS